MLISQRGLDRVCPQKLSLMGSLTKACYYLLLLLTFITGGIGPGTLLIFITLYQAINLFRVLTAPDIGCECRILFRVLTAPDIGCECKILFRGPYCS